MVEGEDVCDFHHYVRVRVDDRWLKLDATWHDELIPFGFSVNSNWKGDEDTRLAATPMKEYPAVGGSRSVEGTDTDRTHPSNATCDRASSAVDGMDDDASPAGLIMGGL